MPPDDERRDIIKYAQKHITDPSGVELYYWDTYKWYIEFPEIKWITDFIDSLSPEEYKFIRIGEDYDDIEYSGCFYDGPFNVSIHRKIVF